MNALLSLAEEWRARAATVRQWTADEGSARAFETAAEELEDAVRDAQDQELTLSEAARESGYSKRRLRELITSGKVPQAGRKGAPRIKRADLPRKPRVPRSTEYDVHADASALAGRLGADR